MVPFQEDIIDRRKILVYLIITVVFFSILFRFFFVQILNREEYYVQAEENRIRPVVVSPIRGLILDRQKRLIVDSVPAYSISVIPYEIIESGYFYDFVEVNFSQDLPLIKRRLDSAPTPYQAVKIKQVDYNELTIFEENLADLPGVMPTIEPQRSYPSGVRISHFLGYIKEINEEEIQSSQDKYYRRGDILGKKGLEKQYEEKLRGEKGSSFYEVDVNGQVVREIVTEDTKPPVHGMNLVLTLDLDLQRLAEDLMTEHKGAVVALNPQNGEIYTAVSRPDYDPMILSGFTSQAEYDSLLLNPMTPLFNRASQSAQPPGSTFKLIGAITALNDDIAPVEREYSCGGYLSVGRQPKYCWKLEGHGTLNMIEAIEQSCNVYFYNLSKESRFTIDRWSYYASLFGFGQKTGLDIPEDYPGILPTKEVMDEKVGEGAWQMWGTMVNLVIGQGELLTTPVQMARFAAAIGTRGKLVEPHFLNYVVEAYTDSVIEIPEYNTEYITEIRDDVWDVIREGMRRVVNGDNGTAKSVRMPDVVVAGKTGTAQNPGDDHAWFIGYAPEENPTIAIVVFIENGGGGGRVAAPVAGSIFREYFRLKRENEDRFAEVARH
ncbi:penicillin-binding protein 2 [candidate division KSB1 bacterium]